MTRPTDPLYPSQNHLDQIGDIEAIWEDYTGRGVSVGVYDDGVQYDHPDLAGNYDRRLHFRDGGTVYDPYPIGSGDGHGTAVAGIIGAVANNGIGGVGVAPGVGLTGVNFLGDIQFQGADLYFASLRWAANFDIMNNSWGRTPVYGASQSLLSGPDAATHAAFGDVVDTGRGGLGTIIIQSAGNDAMNANGSGVTATRFTATIAATDTAGNAASYSNFGANILITAPGTTYTTDMTGSAGYTGGDYTSNFTGTSASAPVVSGVVALMLEANDGLGWRDVQSILAMSAAQTGSAFGGGPIGNEVGSWFENGAGNWNGGGMTFHYSYGFGMLDAFTAVRFAEVWSLLHGAPRTSQNEVAVTASNNTSRSISDFSTTNSAVQVNRNIQIENIEVTIDITHSWSADLTIYLVAPDGTQIALMAEEGGSTLMDDGFQWRFGVTAALGMMSAGTWQLRIVDDARGDTGTLHSFSLTFFGSPVQNYEVHHFTNDIRTFIAAGRTTVEVQSRMDWLNLSGMSGDIVLDLDGTSGWFINFDGIDSRGGNAMSLTDTVRRAVLGDGDDTVRASDFGSTVYAGRGNDVVDGGLRRDELFGQDGNDSLFGDRGNDTLRGGDGNDTLSGGAGSDRGFGGAGNDVLFGSVGRDVLRGEAGSDRLFGGLGNDVLHGNNGHDLLRGDEGSDRLFGGGGNDTLIGDIGNDTLRGGADNDLLMGGANNDLLIGENGNDTLNGGAGTDLLRGGAGVDTFVFARGDGSDIVADFAVNADILLLSSQLVGGALTGDAVIARFGRVVGDDFVLDFGPGGTTIRFDGLGSVDRDLLADRIDFF